MFNDRLAAEIAHVKRKSFVEGYEATDAEALGLILARFFEWDGAAILKTAAYALEDADWHEASAIVASLAEPEKPTVRVYRAPSSRRADTSYQVILSGSGDTCTCPDFVITRKSKSPCKHILAAQSGAYRLVS